jgi:hypothetical protein
MRLWRTDAPILFQEKRYTLFIRTQLFAAELVFLTKQRQAENSHSFPPQFPQLFRNKKSCCNFLQQPLLYRAMP